MCKVTTGDTIMFNNYDIKPLEKRIYLASPTMHGDELKYMTEAYNTNWMSTVGKNIECIESVLTEKLGKRYAVALSTGTAALHLSMVLSGITKGTRVFCSDLTFAATVNPVVYVGGEPILIDSEYDTWNMDPDLLREAFEKYPDVKHVVAVNLFGTPGKLDEIKEICKEHNACFIEDAAESLGSFFNGSPAGSFGDIGVISFNGNKIITGSSGGALITDDAHIAEMAHKLSTQSREEAQWYQHERYGYNYRMSNVVAGVIRGQFPYLKEHADLKAAIYERYKKGFEGLPVKMNPYDAEKCSPNFWLSCMIIDEDAMCPHRRTETEAFYDKEHGKSCPTEIIDALALSNIESRPIWKPMHLQPIYRNNISVGGAVSEDIFARGVCLPSDIKMTEEEQDLVIKIVRSCFD